MKLVFRGAEVAKKIANLARRLPGVVNDELYRVAVDMRGDFEKTTKTWETPVSFGITKHLKGWKVETKSEIYKFVDKGTRAHVIRPKRAGGVLAFKGQYSAKTSPGVIGSRAGGAKGNTVVTKEVHHPGTRARNFTQIIYRKWQKQVPRRVQKAIKGGVEAAGL